MCFQQTILPEKFDSKHIIFPDFIRDLKNYADIFTINERKIDNIFVINIFLYAFETDFRNLKKIV